MIRLGYDNVYSTHPAIL